MRPVGNTDSNLSLTKICRKFKWAGHTHKPRSDKLPKRQSAKLRGPKSGARDACDQASLGIHLSAAWLIRSSVQPFSRQDDPWSITSDFVRGRKVGPGPCQIAFAMDWGGGKKEKDVSWASSAEYLMRSTQSGNPVSLHTTPWGRRSYNYSQNRPNDRGRVLFLSILVPRKFSKSVKIAFLAATQL